ncbi:MAG: FxsA family protein [Gemmatimonadota bacterium]|nr:MAG: FxsA family protein [Gemmatimonadota bacterium]
MLIKLILLFTLIPLVELALLIEVGSRIGIGATLAIVIATGVLGAVLAKSQGLAILHRIRNEISTGQLPADALFDGALILAGGLLLLTPGLLTDALGFSCLIPFSRRGIKDWLRRKIQLRLELRRGHFPGEKE